MKIIATQDEIEALPTWAKDFLDSGWAAPDNAGQRHALPRFDDMRRIAKTFASALDLAMQDPDAVARHFTFAVNEDGGRFVTADFWNDRSLEIAFKLATIWNSKLSLSNCATCGNLIQPNKGRAATYCSTKCRMQAHRGAA